MFNRKVLCVQQRNGEESLPGGVGTVYTTVSGRKLQRHKSGNGTVMRWDDNGVTKDTLILDCNNWVIEKCINGNKTTDLKLYKCTSTGAVGYLGNNWKDVPDSVLNTMAQATQDPNSSRVNTDNLVGLSSATSTVAVSCREKVVCGNKCDAPNINLLLRIYSERDQLNALDPTVTILRGWSIWKVSIVIGAMTEAWASSWYGKSSNSYYGLRVGTTGTVNKAEQNSSTNNWTPPVLEFENMYKVAVVQSPHQVITVTSNGYDFTSDEDLRAGNTYSASIVAEEAYYAGTVNHPSGTVSGDVTISATAAVARKPCYVTVAQSAHQEITVVYGYNSSKHTASFQAYEGYSYSASIKNTDEEYFPGTLNHVSGTISDDMTVSATSAMARTPYLVVVEQSSHQEITVTYGWNGSKHTVSFQAYEGYSYSASIKNTDEEYFPGTLNHSSGTISGDVTVNATAATKRTKYTITIKQSSHQTIEVDYYWDHSEHTSTFYAYEGYTIHAYITADEGYYAGDLSFVSGTVNSNLTIEATPATPIES